MLPALLPVALLLTLLLTATAARAQETPAKPGDVKVPIAEINQTIFLRNVIQQNDLNDIQTDLRNTFPHLRVFSVATKNAITLHGTAEDVAAGQKMIADSTSCERSTDSPSPSPRSMAASVRARRATR
jgi:hypothetical protein